MTKFGEEIGYWEPDGGPHAVGSVSAPSSPIQPRFVVDTHPTIRVLDRAYCHRVVREWKGQGRKRADEIPQAIVYAAHLNALDRRGEYDGDIADVVSPSLMAEWLA